MHDVPIVVVTIMDEKGVRVFIIRRINQHTGIRGAYALATMSAKNTKLSIRLRVVFAT